MTGSAKAIKLSSESEKEAIRLVAPAWAWPEPSPGATMSKAFIAAVIQESAELTGAAATRAAGDLIEALVRELKKEGKFTLPSFGTFTVRKTKARQALNPRTGEPVKVKAGKTVRFKASPNLKH